MKKLAVFCIVIVIFSCKTETKNSQGENFSKNVNKVAKTIVDDSQQLAFFNNPINPLQPKFQQFSSGSVKPKGWILQMMKNDLETGVVGALKELYPGIASDDLYHTARRGGMEDIPEMGDLVLTGAEWEQSIMWWNAETIGNWWDGYIRHAFLTENKAAIGQSHKIVQNLLHSQDKDGYIGIYKPNLRYQHKGSNGELWAQTTAFRTMLAYYEFTKNQSVLEAVEKGMKVTMNNYGENSKNPFYLKNAFGGVTHGLMLTDVCETLYRITGKKDYQNYATYLYKAFSTYSINRSFNDLRYPYLIEKDSLFEGHAVHTYEHIRTMANAYYNTGYNELKTAYNNMLSKLQPCILPSGAAHGNEWIAKLNAHPDHTSTEYCAMLELRNSYGSLIQKTGDIQFADQAEKLTYNAMLGFRNTKGTAIAYGKPDNCFILDGKHHENGESKEDPRYKYSPTHSEPAVCCVPNYGRNFTYFLEQMWAKTTNGITAIMYGPSQLSTTINGQKIRIEQETNYPLSDKVVFRFKMENPIEFSFQIRKPNWSEDIESELALGELNDGFYTINKVWKDGDSFSVIFKNNLKKTKTTNNEYYLQRGPLVYAYEISHRKQVIKSYGYNNFEDFYCFPETEAHHHLKIPDNLKFEVQSANNSNFFYDIDWQLNGQLFDASKDEFKEVSLVPMGKTVLRRITFPKKE